MKIISDESKCDIVADSYALTNSSHLTNSTNSTHWLTQFYSCIDPSRLKY